jgi:hypothetical protein
MSRRRVGLSASLLASRRRGRGRLLTVPLVLIAALSLSGCESTAEKSAKLERVAKHVTVQEKGLSITRHSRKVRVLGTAVVHSSEGTAATVTVQNRTGAALREVPLAVAVKDAKGHTTAQNDAGGLESALVSVSSIGPHATLTWVDDQLPSAGAATNASASVGEAPAAGGPAPKLTIEGQRLTEEAGGALATGTVTNHSSIEQSKLVVFAVVRRGASVLAAGRAVLPQLAAKASMPFQAYLIGDATGGKLELAAPPTTFR